MARTSVLMERSLGATDKETRATSKKIAVDKARRVERRGTALVGPRVLARVLQVMAILEGAPLERNPRRVA